MEPCIHMEKDVIFVGIEYSSKDVSPPTFLSNEDIIIDTPP